MNKFNTLFLSAFLLLPISASAQLLDAIRGHAQDLKSRFEDNQKVEGEILKRGQIDKNANILYTLCASRYGGISCQVTYVVGAFLNE